MRSRLPKPLHAVCGKPILFHLLDALRAAGIERIVVVVGHEADRVRAAIQERYGAAIAFADQDAPRGTGHAVQVTASHLPDHTGPLLILPGDTPLLRTETLQALLAAHTGGATILSALLPDAGAYGRIVRDDSGAVTGIVEARDATPEQRALREINAGVYVFDAPALFAALTDLRDDNAQGELYLTDAIALLRAAGQRVRALVADDPDVTLGVNTRIELAAVEARLRTRLLEELMLAGVTITDPATTYVEAGVQVGQDTTLLPGTHLLSGSVIGQDCRIGPYTIIENAIVGDGCRVGPFARLRPGTRLERGARVGNFVETKNAQIGAGVAAGHLSYLGDTVIGEGANIGAGTITCNYDGFGKHVTTIGADAFIGSNSTLVAPVTIEDGAATAAGSVINQRVGAGDLGIGRARQENKEGWWASYRARKERDRHGQRQ